MKKLKWWVRILLNAAIAFGFAFFSCLGGMEIGGQGFDWFAAFITASIMGGLSFFTILKAYFYPTEPAKPSNRTGREFKASSSAVSRPPIVEQKEEETEECSRLEPGRKGTWTLRKAIECLDGPLMFI